MLSLKNYIWGSLCEHKVDCWFMGLNKRPILSYNRRVIYVVPGLRQESFSMGGRGGHWVPFGGPKSDFLFHKLERRPLCPVLCASKAYLPLKTHSFPLWFVPVILSLTSSTLWSHAGLHSCRLPFEQCDGGTRGCGEAGSKTPRTGAEAHTGERTGDGLKVQHCQRVRDTVAFWKREENRFKCRMLCPV